MSNKSPKQKGKQKRPRPKDKRPRSLASRVIGLVLTAGGFIGVVSAVLTFFPRLTASVGQQPGAGELGGETFTITNTGLLPLYNVSACMGLAAVTPKRYLRTETVEDLPQCKIEWLNHKLGIDESLTLTGDEIISSKILEVMSNADLTVTIMYRPLPLRIVPLSEKIFRFRLARRLDDIPYWYAIPSDRPHWVFRFSSSSSH
jgi:hypothetical protein